MRDMNTPRESDNKDSTDEEFKFFSEAKMKTLLNKYNNSYHVSIDTTPKKMFDDQDLEKEYVFKMMNKSKKVERLNDGEKVRIITPSARYLEKKRYRFSPEYYKISGMDGNMYNVQSADGTIITRPRYLLRKMNDVENSKMRFAKTIPGKSKGVIEQIKKYVNARGKEVPQNIASHAEVLFENNYLIEFQ
jgi:hypothetical protein